MGGHRAVGGGGRGHEGGGGGREAGEGGQHKDGKDGNKGPEKTGKEGYDAKEETKVGELENGKEEVEDKDGEDGKDGKDKEGEVEEEQENGKEEIDDPADGDNHRTNDGGLHPDARTGGYPGKPKPGPRAKGHDIHGNPLTTADPRALDGSGITAGEMANLIDEVYRESSSWKSPRASDA